MKHGKQPPETKQQFCIPAEWIKTLDPRIKEKIRTETRADMEAKGKIEREKKEADLDKKIKAKKATEADKQMELKTFDQMLENRIQNEIAKRIDKAHNYSFNLANYKSTISDSQMVEWTEALKHIRPNGATTVEEVYKKLKNGKPENILPYLLKLNPANALEADIAREYVSNLDNDLIAQHKELNVIKEILKSGAKYPMVKLKDYLILNENKIKPNKNPDVNYKVLGVSNEVGVFLNEKLQAEETNQSYFVVAKNEFCYNPYRINVGSIGLNTNDYDNQIISGAYIVFACKEDELNPKYLDTLFKSKGFLAYVNGKANGGVRMNFKFEDMEAWEIPLPSLEEQNIIVTQIEKQKAIIEGADLVLKNWEVDDYLNLTSNEDSLSNIAYVDGQIIKDEKLREKFEEIYVGGENIESCTGRLSNLKTVEEAGVVGPSYIFKPGQIVYSKVRPNLQKCFYADFEGICSSDIYPLTVFNQNVVPEYFARVLQSKYFASKTQVFQDRAGMPKVNRDQLATINISLPDKLEQYKIVETINTQIQVLEGLRKMKAEAQKKINQILADVWGEDLEEAEKEEAENE